MWLLCFYSWRSGGYDDEGENGHIAAAEALLKDENRNDDIRLYIQESVQLKSNENSINEKPVPFEDAIRLAGHGKFQYLALLYCGLCMMAVDIGFVNTSILLPSAECDFQMTLRDKGILNAIVYIGMACSSHLWGYLADTRGRKHILVGCLIADTICYILGSFAHSFGLFVFIRFFNGFFISACSAVTFPYLGEFYSSAHRTQAVMMCAFFNYIGSILVPILAWVTIPLPWNFELPLYTYHSWRLFVLICGIPGFISAILVAVYLPESPKFLLAQGNEKKALEILQLIYTTNTGNSPSQYQVKSVILDDTSEVKKPSNGKKHNPVWTVLRSMWKQTAPLFVPPHLRNTALCFILMFFYYCSGVSFILWIPDILNNMYQYSDVHPEGAPSVCEAITYSENMFSSSSSSATNYTLSNVTFSTVSSMISSNETCISTVDTDAFKNTLILSGVSGVLYFFSGRIVKYTGSKLMFVGSLILSAICAVAMDFIVDATVLLILSCFYVTFNLAAFNVFNSVIIDIFPTHLKAMALSLSMMMGRSGTAVGSLLLSSLLDYSCDAMFFVLGAIACISGLLSCLLPENIGRPLQT